MRPWIVSSVGAAVGVVLVGGAVAGVLEISHDRARIERLAEQQQTEAKQRAEAQASQQAAAVAAASSAAAKARQEAAQAKAIASRAAASAAAAKRSAAVTRCGTVAGYAVTANAATSCPFALIVADGYVTYGDSFSSYSPVTGRWYDLHCTPYPVTCRGGNGAEIYLR